VDVGDVGDVFKGPGHREHKKKQAVMRPVYSNAAAPEHVHDVHYVYLGRRLVVGTKGRLLVKLGVDMLRR